MASLDEVIVSIDNNLAEVFVETVGANADGILVFGAGLAALESTPAEIDVKVLALKGSCKLKGSTGPANNLQVGETFKLKQNESYTVDTTTGGYCVWLATRSGNLPGNHPRPKPFQSPPQP